MRGRLIVALLASVGALVACSLLTSLDEPREAGLSDAALCTPEVISDLGTDASITSLYVDQQGGMAYFVSTPLGNVYSVALDSGAGTTPTTVMTGLPAPERLAVAYDTKHIPYVYVAAFGKAAGPGGLYVLMPDAGVQSVADGGLHAYGVAASGLEVPTLYWTNCAQPGCNTGAGEVLVTSPSGVTTTLTTVDAGARDILLTANDVAWWVDMSATLNTIGSDGGLRAFTCGGVLTYASSATEPRVYFTTTNTCSSRNVIQFIATEDPSATPAVFDDNGSGLVDGPSSLSYDGSKYLYWANLTGGTIARKDTTTNATDEMVAASPGTPRQIVWIPPGILYWTTDSGLVRCVL